MTPRDAARLIAYLMVMFPTAKVSRDSARGLALALLDLEADEAEQVVAEAVLTHRWFPSLSELRLIAVRRRAGIPSESEAYGQIVRRSTDPTTAPALHPLASEALRLMGGLHSFRESTDPVRWQAQFTRLYADVVSRSLREDSLSGAGVPLEYEPGARPLDAALANPDVQRLIDRTARELERPPSGDG